MALVSAHRARKKFEAAYRELERKTELNQATTKLESRKNRDINDTLSRRKEEIAEMRQMMQHQTIEISNLQADKAKLEKRVGQYEKKLSQCAPQPHPNP
jgi:chromosome segregation ATPase